MNEYLATNKLHAIDEQICVHLQQRKELVSHKPRFPSDETIREWTQQYGFEETFLARIFSWLRSEKYYQPHVEPTDFHRYFPVLQSVDINKRLYTVSVIRQYHHASVGQLLVDGDALQEPVQDIREKLKRHHFGSFISDHYECHTFIVTPPLPDHIEGLDFIFTEYKDVFEEPSTGFEVTIQG
ncbi:hypothetical protein I6G82_07095 [Lysinibacillus macroides]|uniref:Uncharacterized protein n=1 Tax=Lysinibacillus macroides TaxID=33935 RepID=A0A0M9DN30_9BACI|nr:hypothetical protein [Lysinibacillus macroides]KOY83492.1 hypothetical protein ADM90_09585 [Lysinibacillus macroides]QPR69363.1 hypothetical protein I6G82_07095 [Lysinibacillus macroides]